MTEADNVSIDVAALQQELALSQKKAEEYLDGWKRAKADYLNLKKSTESQQLELIQFANAGLLAQLLPIISHFKLAWQHVPEDQRTAEWVKGFEHIKNQLTEFLNKIGIEEIKTVGEVFNPDVHEAVAHEAKDGVATDTIFEEVGPGYQLHGKLLQPARVKVAK